MVCTCIAGVLHAAWCVFCWLALHNMAAVLLSDQKGAMRWVMQRYDSILAGIPAMEMEWDSETSSWIEVVTE